MATRACLSRQLTEARRRLPWLELLARCFAAGWMLVDVNSLGVNRMWSLDACDDIIGPWEWTGSVTDAPEEVYRAVEAALKEKA